MSRCEMAYAGSTTDRVFIPRGYATRSWMTPLMLGFGHLLQRPVLRGCLHCLLALDTAWIICTRFFYSSNSGEMPTTYEDLASLW